MANEIITTALTASYGQDDGDSLYIAEGGQILTTGFSSSLTNTLAASDFLNILMYGKVISQFSTAISLFITSSTTSGFGNLTIGTTGVARCVAGKAIKISCGAEDIRNHRSVIAGTIGIDCVGASNSILNTGDVSGEKAIVMSGGNTSLNNAGRLSGEFTAVQMRGDGAVSNTVQILAGLAARGQFSNGALKHTQFGTACDTNSGTILSTGGAAIEVEADSRFVTFALSNEGSISGFRSGLLFQYDVQPVSFFSRVAIMQ